MADQSPFCPYCGAQQIKAGARFCHACGQPIPIGPTPVPDSIVRPPSRPRRTNLRWLLLLVPVVLVLAAAALAWQRGLLGLGLRDQWTPAAISGGSAPTPGTPGEAGDARGMASPVASPMRTTGPAATPLTETRSQAAATSQPSSSTATPPPTATPPFTATPPATATPPGTATPPPTPTAVAARTNGAANVRSGPGTAYPIVGQVPAGTTLVIQGQNSAGTWWQVCCLRDKPGWILAELLPVTAPVRVPAVADIPPPPDPGRVVFVSDRSSFAHLFATDGNGSGLRQLTSGSEYFWDPVLSEDGTQLAFVSKVGGNTEIFVANRDGGGRRAISNHPAEDDHPAWFPGNTSLAFASRRDGPWEIYRMAANGTNVRRLTSNGGDSRFVAVSPDGTQIAFVAQAGSYPAIQLMVMNADGSNPRPLLSFDSRKQRDDPGRFIYRPDWSPDGTQLAFGADDDNDGLVSVLAVNVASGQAQRLIRDGNSPAWSPDGQRLIYKPAGDRQILYVADSGGNPLYQLTGSDNNAWSPDWAR